MSLSAKSYAQEVIVVKEQPPVPKVEVITNPPAPGSHWIPSHWKWRQNQWVWEKGRWSKPPRQRHFGSQTTGLGVPTDGFIDQVAGFIEESKSNVSGGFIAMSLVQNKSWQK